MSAHAAAGPAGTARSLVAEYDELIAAIQPAVRQFIGDAEPVGSVSEGSNAGSAGSRGPLIRKPTPLDADALLTAEGGGPAALAHAAEQVLAHSVNTWHQGFLSKLYSSPHPVGAAAELLLGVLNTNVHVYDVSPALSEIERAVAARLARLFGLAGPRAGGLAQPGGSAANLTALVVARNTMFPKTKEDGLAALGGRRLALFTSRHGHYSFEKAAQVLGLGTKAVWTVATDAAGRMDPEDLEAQILKAKRKGQVPFFVNATAGTTVLGSYDPIDGIADVAERQGLWLHVDASWGGAVVFSGGGGTDGGHRHKLHGSHRAHSITYNPHKMLNVPVTCSFLLLRDLGAAHAANTLPADYLFHGSAGADAAETDTPGLPRDIADMTLQCGRRGDALKLALAWTYYGSQGLAARVDGAFEVAAYLAGLVRASPHLVLVGGSDPPPCLQVCFYYAREKSREAVEAGLAGEESDAAAAAGLDPADADTSRITTSIVAHLARAGFSVDFASVPERPGQRFCRAVVHVGTRRETCALLVAAAEQAGLESQGAQTA